MTATAALVVAAASTMVLAAGAQATGVTIGQLAPEGAPRACNSQYDNLQAVRSTGPGYEVPSDGVITSWSTNNTAPLPGQEMTFKLFKAQPGGEKYEVIAHDGPHPLVAGVNTFNVHIPVAGGEIIGLNTANATFVLANVCEFEAGELLSDRTFTYSGNGADGGTIGPDKGLGFPFRVNVSATFLATPEIDSFARTSLGSIAGGGQVTLEGNHFEEVEKVTFGGVPAIGFTTLDDHHVIAVAPKGTTLSGIAAAVTTPAGTATSTPFFFYSGCQVPKLTGKTLGAAKRRATAAGCKLGRVFKVRGRHGKVLRQSAGHGRLLPPGAKIGVKVGR